MIVRSLIPILIFIPILLLQIYVVPVIEISGAVPDLILIVLIYFTLREGQLYAMILAMAYGFIYDISTGNLIGASMLSRVITAFIVGYFYNENKSETYLGNPIFPLIVLLGGFLNSAMYNLIVNFDINLNIAGIILFSALFPALYSAFVGAVGSMLFDTFGMRKSNG
ncbi:MAG: rod shape-determining protein MreD [Ignavibacteriaceae bacterium]|nr:rod shape-determining protein MreD [Ignavibacteriaceae bacterium]